jgi:ankyrin repeat protein
LAVVQLLTEKGADSRSEDRQGGTSLSRAAANGHLAMLQLLIEKGADFNFRDGCGLTPLSRAAASRHAAVVRLLVDKGADSMKGENGNRTTGQTNPAVAGKNS